MASFLSGGSDSSYSQNKPLTTKIRVGGGSRGQPSSGGPRGKGFTHAFLLLAARALHDECERVRELLIVQECVLAVVADTSAVEALQADENAVGAVLAVLAGRSSAQQWTAYLSIKAQRALFPGGRCELGSVAGSTVAYLWTCWDAVGGLSLGASSSMCVQAMVLCEVRMRAMEQTVARLVHTASSLQTFRTEMEEDNSVKCHVIETRDYARDPGHCSACTVHDGRGIWDLIPNLLPLRSTGSMLIS